MRLRLVMFGGAATSLALAAASLVIAAPATAAPADPRARAVAKLKASSDRTPALATDGSGVVTNLRTAPGHPVERPAGVRKGASAELTARGLVQLHGAAFGLKDGDDALRTQSTITLPGGLNVVRFQQTVADLPVLGGDLTTTVRPDGGTVSVNSTLSTAPTLATKPEVGASHAAATARARTAQAESLKDARALRVATPELVMFDPAVFGAPLRPGLRPVWQTKVTGESPSGPIAADVLVDARTGTVTLYADALHAAKSRQVCDHGAKALGSALIQPGQLCPAGQSPGGPVPGGTVEATEASPPAADAHADVKNAFEFSGRTYDFFNELFGRDSVDAAGKQLRSSVRYCLPDPASGASCLQNAYWDGEQMVYAPGFASADDVVAHELTHGVVEHTANLFYWYQAGAINESMADVFGELVDQFDARAGEDATVEAKWLIAEDLSIGALRSMADPETYGDPKSMTSPKYKGANSDPRMHDSGGVHSNSGVGNHAAYLIATGLGGDAAALSKTAHLYYATLTSLSSGADYADLARTLQSSCADLVNAPLPLAAKQIGGVGPATVTVTAADCTVVANSIATTEMTAQPVAPNSAAPDAPFCPDGTEPTSVQTLFSDDMENPASGNWSYTAQDPNRDQWDAVTGYHDPADPFFQGTSYAHSGQTSMIGFSADDGTNTAAGNVGRIQTAASIAVPTGKQTFLWFAHADDLSDGTNDGARVSAAYTEGEIDRLVDVGVPDASTSPAANGYRGTLRDGRPAFVGDSHGYISTRFDLTRFAGKSIKPTFDIVGNAVTPTNWWIDDVKVYTCAAAAPSMPKAPTATPSSTTATATLAWTAPEWTGASGLKGYRVEEGKPGDAGYRLIADLSADITTYTVRDLSTAKYYPFTVKAVGTGDTPGLPVSVAMVPTTSTLYNSPSVTTYGGSVTVYGTVLRTGTTTKLAGATVTVQARAVGSTKWSTAGSTRSISGGTWKLVYRPGQNLEYRALVSAGPGLWAGAGQRSTSQGVAAKVSANFRATTVRRGQTAAVAVAVAPGRTFTVELQLRSGTKWVVVQRRTTSTKGIGSLTVKATKRGKFSYRVVTRAQSSHRAGVSPIRTLSVR